MSPQTFIFIGRSGCGKGTQVELLKKYVQEKDPNGEIFYLETGAQFREFVKGEGYSNVLSNKVYKTGERQPDFLAVWMWANYLINNFKGTEHAFFDGITRSLPEAMTFTTAMEFYNRKPVVIHINVSRDWSEARLSARGRADDINIDEIRKRLDWFDKDSAPAIDYFNVHSQYKLIEVNGEQPIEDVHKEILNKLNF
jgi:adenylate kinase family enzyme